MTRQLASLCFTPLNNPTGLYGAPGADKDQPGWCAVPRLPADAEDSRYTAIADRGLLQQKVRYG
jgi:hypothetical protein